MNTVETTLSKLQFMASIRAEYADRISDDDEVFMLKRGVMVNFEIEAAELANEPESSEPSASMWNEDGSVARYAVSHFYKFPWLVE